MASITRFLADMLKLTVNVAKSAVAPPWKRNFLGYSLRWHKAPKPKIAPTSLKRLEDKIREVLQGARGRCLTTVITELNPILRGWMAYFKLTETKKVLEELVGWLRHKLRCILWRQWKRPYTRAKNLMKAGLTEERAFRSAFNQRGPWWNSGASHMNQAFPKSSFDRLGLVSLLDTMSSVFNEPPDAEPHVRWCERATGVIPSPTRLIYRVGLERSDQPIWDVVSSFDADGHPTLVFYARPPAGKIGRSSVCRSSGRGCGF